MESNVREELLEAMWDEEYRGVQWKPHLKIGELQRETYKKAQEEWREAQKNVES